MKIFKIGDKVTWTLVSADPPIAYEGILMSIKLPTVHFGKDSSFYKRWPNHEQYTFSDWTYIDLAISSKEKVSRKIELLWKTSNWVKTHPNLRY